MNLVAELIMSATKNRDYDMTIFRSLFDKVLSSVPLPLFHSKLPHYLTPYVIQALPYWEE